MGRKSSIHQLPKDIKVDLDKLIEKGSATIDEMMQYLESQGADVSRSSVGRYKKNIDKTLEKIRQSREIAEVLTKELGDSTESEMSGAIREILRSLVFDFMTTNDKTPSDKQLANIARAMKDLEHSAHISQDRESKIRKEIREEMERKAEEAASNVEDIVKDKGLSKGAINDIRKHILGISNDAE